MSRKAVVVGVGDYQGYATPLTAPPREVDEWVRLLAQYHFYDVLPLKDAQATRPAVEEALRKMVKEVEPDSQLVFVFVGHGKVVPAHDSGYEPFEEALMLYPDGDATLKSAELTDSDIAEIFEAVPSDAETTIIVDACFAGYFDAYPPAGAKALFIRNTEIEGGMSLANVRAFGSVGTREYREAAPAGPVVVAACKRDQVAYEIPTGNGTARMLFTSRAVPHLEQQVVTLDALVREIYPLAKDYREQEPEIRGNLRAAMRHFPEDPAETRTAYEALEKVRLTDASVLTGSSVDVVFDGICCFADSRSTTDPYQKRVLFPYDDRRDPNMRHFAFVEIRKDDVSSSTGPAPKKYTRPNSPVEYWRWELQGHRVHFANAANTSPLTVTPAFNAHVPGMTAVEPAFKPGQYHPRQECFETTPPTTILDGYLDLASGELGIVDPDTVKTKFVRQGGAVTLEIFGCRYTTLRLPLATADAQLVLIPYAGGATFEISVKAGGIIRIGSMREGDLIPDNTVEDPQAHFALYYNLAATKPLNPPLPVRVSVPVNFCSQTTWP